MVEDVPPRAAWQALCDEPGAVLCDVRTEPEWAFVGLPDLGQAGKAPVLIPWQVYPTMQQNPDFLKSLAEAGVGPDQPLFFLCRSGGRSRAAAIAAAAAGYSRVFNIADGFEGPVSRDGRRGTLAGWKAEGLPWRQG